MLEFIKTIVNALKLYIDEKFVSSRPDWNQNDASAENYIENKPFYEEEKEVVLVENLTSEDYSNEEVENPACNFVPGNVYRVIWNGEVYDNLVCYFDGEFNIIASSDNGCPFYIDDDGGNALYVEDINGDGTWTVSIIEYKTELKKIDLKYLPDDIGVQSDWNQNDEDAKDYIKNRPFYEKETNDVILEKTNFEIKDNMQQVLPNIVLEDERQYRVVFDGKAYLTKAKYQNNIDELNFNIYFEDGSYIFIDCVGYVYLENTNPTLIGDHTIEILTYDIELKTIEEKFLPKRNEMIFIDKVTGLEYIVSMINGKIVYESLIEEYSNIYVDIYPSQMIYGVNDELNTDGMVIAAYCQDGTTKEIVTYTCSKVDEDGKVTITYEENKNVYTTNLYVEIIEYLEDFNCVDNGDGTVTITGWKGTCKGEPSTEMILPDDSRVIL